MRLTLTEYKKFDKIISENEPEFLQERLDNFGLEDYQGWFNGFDTKHIRDTIKEYGYTLSD